MSGIINHVGSKSGIIGLVDLGDRAITTGIFNHTHVGFANPTIGGTNFTLVSSTYYLLTARAHHTSNMNEQYMMLTDIKTNSSGTVSITNRANNFAGSPHWVVSSSTTNQITCSNNHASYSMSFYLTRMGSA